MSQIGKRHLLGLAAAAALAPQARAQGAFPDRPVAMIIPFAAGGPTDVIGRLLAQAMAADLGQPVVVENVAGAGGTLGAQRVAQARPDGRTILLQRADDHRLLPRHGTGHERPRRRHRRSPL